MVFFALPLFVLGAFLENAALGEAMHLAEPASLDFGQFLRPFEAPPVEDLKERLSEP